MLGCLLCLMDAKTSDPELHVRSFPSFVATIMYTTLRPSLSRNDTQIHFRLLKCIMLSGSKGSPGKDGSFCHLCGHASDLKVIVHFHSTQYDCMPP